MHFLGVSNITIRCWICNSQCEHEYQRLNNQEYDQLFGTISVKIDGINALKPFSIKVPTIIANDSYSFIRFR